MKLDVGTARSTAVQGPSFEGPPGPEGAPDPLQTGLAPLEHTPTETSARPTNLATWTQQAQAVFRKVGENATRGALLGAIGVFGVGCTTVVEREVPLPSGQVQTVELREPVLDLRPAQASNQARAAQFRNAVNADPALSRLPTDLRQILEAGILAPRSAGTRGQAGVLGVQSALRAARAFLALDAGAQARFRGLLGRAGGRAPDVERALLLKALGAHGAVTNKLESFATAIRGQPRTELMRRTTALDVHDQNTSGRDPTRLFAMSDRFGDNDALYQRYTNTCVPTVGQMVRAERDPAYAWSLHADLQNRNPGAGGGREQARILSTHAGAVVSRLGAQSDGSRVDIDRLVAPLDAPLADAILAHVSGRNLGGAAQADLQRALDRLAQLGTPISFEALEAVRAARVEPSLGMNIVTALNAVLGTGAAREHVYTPDRFSALVDLVTGGAPVPIRVGNRRAGHVLLATDARVHRGEAHVLLTDPWEGRTAWVSQSDFDSGRFLYRTFRLSHPGVTHYYPLSE